MPSAELILCEPEQRLLLAVRRALGDARRVQQTRFVEDCRSMLAAAPNSLLLLELNPDPLEAQLDLLAEIPHRFPLARSVVALPRGPLAAYEWLLRELGVTEVIPSPPRQLQPLAGLITRHLRRCQAANEQADPIFRRLPWGDLPIPGETDADF